MFVGEVLLVQVNHCGSPRTAGSTLAAFLRHCHIVELNNSSDDVVELNNSNDDANVNFCPVPRGCTVFWLSFL